jgi:hypothetical protein
MHFSHILLFFSNTHEKSSSQVITPLYFYNLQTAINHQLLFLKVAPSEQTRHGEDKHLVCAHIWPVT